MKEIVIISGKGGTGKTSLTASFAVLAGRCVIADADVDAPDLHFLFAPRIAERHEFRAGHEAFIRPDACIGCGLCQTYCRFDAVKKITPNGNSIVSKAPYEDCRDCVHCERSCPLRTRALIRELSGLPANSGDTACAVDPLRCEGCGVCVRFCPVQAIDFPERRCGEWMLSETRVGPMVHARLAAAAENSGKLVSTVRREARSIAEKAKIPLILVDGPPGIGCPVIASMTGATLVLAVTEPTVTGRHDLERVLELARHFSIPASICVNKWDINPEMTEDIEKAAVQAGALIAGRVRYDPQVSRAQILKKAVVEIDAASAEDIRRVWYNFYERI